MKGSVKKIMIVSLFSAIPLGVMVCRDFIQYGRGWHSLLIQYHSFFWLTRLLLTPFLVLGAQQLWKKAGNPFKLFLYPLISFLIYNLLCWTICFISCRSLAFSFDGRNKNLFDTIRQESTMLNLLIYVATILIVFTWQYYERNKESVTRSHILEQSLAKLKSDLQIAMTQEDKRSGDGKISSIAVKNGHRTVLISIIAITCIQSNGPYINIITESGNYLLKKSLSALEKTLPISFLRVHRSSIVNMAFVKELRSLTNGDGSLVLKNEKEVRFSRNYRETLVNMLNKG